MKRSVRRFIRRCAVIAAVCSTALLSHSVTAQTQGFPNRPLKMSVGFPPGTGPDLVARLVSQRLTELFKQPVVVENKPGAGAQIATVQIAKSASDGYNLLLAEAGSVSIAPAAFSKLPYDAARELVGVAELAYADFVLVVPAESPHKTLAALVSASKARPEALNFATFGAGTPGHFAAAEFGKQAGLKIEPIHYRSAGDALTAIISNSVTGAWVSVAVANATIKGGKMRGLAITARERSPMLPEVPTAAEAGLPNLTFSSWLGVLAPAGTPAATLDVLNRRLVEAVHTPDVKQKLEEAGFRVTGTSRVETDRMLSAEAQRWAAVVKSTGFRGD